MFNTTSSERDESIRNLAAELRAYYEPEPDYSLVANLKSFPTFGKWDGRHKVKNLIQLDDAFLETRIKIFDHIITKQAGNTTVRYKRTVFFFESKKIGLPEMMMQPEGFFRKVAQFFGFEDIDFEEHPEFSNQYWLKGDEELVRASMNNEILHYFSVERGWTMQTLNYYLVLYKDKQLLSSEDIKKYLTGFSGLIKHFEASAL